MSHRDGYRGQRRSEPEKTTSPEAMSASIGKRTLTMDLAGDTPATPAQVQRMLDPSSVTRLRATVRPDIFGGQRVPPAPNSADVQMKGGSAPGPDVHKLAAEGVSGSSMSLPFRDQIQRSFGDHDVSDIQSHVAGPATSACQGMGAQAYATGNHIAFRGTPDLHTAAHEAAHVVQQRAGVQLKSGVGEVGDEHERNADQVADAVVAGRSAEALLGAAPGSKHAERSGGPRRAVATPMASDPALRATGSVQAKMGKDAPEHSPCSQCGGEDCECSDGSNRSGSVETESKTTAKSSSVAESTPAAESKVPIENDLPIEVVRYMAQLGITSPEALTKEQTQRLGRLAKGRMSHDKIIATGRRFGVNLPNEERTEQPSKRPEQSVQRQVGPGEAAAATAGTMWWLTLVDGPLPFGDIAYGIAIAAAAITAAVTASSAIEKICSDRLTGCLENPWQPPRNRDMFGPRKDCGACYRECKLQLGIWPDYKCPR